MENLFTAIRDIVCEQLGVRSEEVKQESSFIDDLGADSLDTVELIMASEEKFNIEISDEVAEKMYTVGDAIRYIKTKVGLSSMPKNKA